MLVLDPVRKLRVVGGVTWLTPAVVTLYAVEPPLFRFRYIQPATSPAAVAIGGKFADAVEVREASGRMTVVVLNGEMMICEASVVGFSCSSKRTRSITRMPVPLFDVYAEQAAFGPVTPSRQIL